MLFIYLFGIGLGYTLQPETRGFGLPLLLIGPASLLRAAPILVHRRWSNNERHFPGPFGVILESVLRVIVILAAVTLASGVVLFATIWVSYSWIIASRCFPRHEEEYAFAAGLAAASVVGLLILYLLGRQIFPPKD